MALKAFPFQPTAEERRTPWPLFCRCCGQLIAPEAPVRRCYRGFLYHEHVECPRQLESRASRSRTVVDLSA